MLMSVFMLISDKLQQLQIKHLPMEEKILTMDMFQAKETYVYAVRICG